MQTLGTALQLSGSVITFFGLLYAWHTTSGRLGQLRDALGDRLNKLLSSIASLRSAGTAYTGGASATIEVDAKAEGQVTHPGTPEQRLEQLETWFNTLNNQLREVTPTLRGDMNEAIAAVLKDFQEQSNAIRLRDTYPALAGILISITGYIVQLVC